MSGKDIDKMYSLMAVYVNSGFVFVATVAYVDAGQLTVPVGNQTEKGAVCLVLQTDSFCVAFSNPNRRHWVPRTLKFWPPVQGARIYGRFSRSKLE